MYSIIAISSQKYFRVCVQKVKLQGTGRCTRVGWKTLERTRKSQDSRYGWRYFGQRSSNEHHSFITPSILRNKTNPICFLIQSLVTPSIPTLISNAERKATSIQYSRRRIKPIAKVATSFYFGYRKFPITRNQKLS